MNKRVGLWLDDNKAVVISLFETCEERRVFQSGMAYQVRFSDATPGNGMPEDVRDRQYWKRFDEYYDRLLEHIQDAYAIQIFGPGDAKFELRKRLELAGLMDCVVSLTNAGRLTDFQIVARVRDCFPE